MMKRLYVILLSVLVPFFAHAQGWPANYNGVMLQAFYWDSFADS
jgi:alpha-amylase